MPWNQDTMELNMIELIRSDSYKVKFDCSHFPRIYIFIIILDKKNYY